MFSTIKDYFKDDFWSIEHYNLQIMNWKIKPHNVVIFSKLTKLVSLITMSRSKNCSNSIGLRNPHSFLSAVYFSVIVNLSSFDYYDFYFTYKDKMT